MNTPNTMEYKVKINISPQAKLLLKEMPSIDEKDLIKWFINHRKIWVGGGDVIDFLKGGKND